MSHITNEELMSLPKVLNEYLMENNLAQAALVLEDNRYSISLKSNVSDTVAVIIKYLTTDNFQNKNELFMSCENMLKVLAEKCNLEEILFEYLEILEGTKDDEVFTTILKCLQIIILREKEKKTRSIEWCLNGVITYLEGLPISEEVKSKIEDKEEIIIENSADAGRIVKNYLTVLLFIEPIKAEYIRESGTTLGFRDNSFTKNNILACFILQLFGTPFAFLNLKCPETKLSRTYSRQCAETLVQMFASLFTDVYSLLEYVEKRMKWPVRDRNGVYENSPNNIFMSSEKTPIFQIAVLYYLIVSEDLLPVNTPKIYSRLYIFRKSIYLVVGLMKCTENSLVYKGLKLCDQLIENLETEKLNADELNEKIHVEFCRNLTSLIVYSSSERNRKAGVVLLKKYILKFDITGKYLLIHNLMMIIEHNGLYGYLSTLYKDMVAEELNSGQNNISKYCCGNYMKEMLLNNICLLKKGPEIDLMENSDRLISALNIVRFLSIRDKNNQTNIWELIDDLKNSFLKPLRTALDLSRSHYEDELKRVTSGAVAPEDDKMEIEIANSDETGGMPNLNKDKKMNLLNGALITFDVIESLLARVNECVDSTYNANHMT